jgi:phosphomethylpyrimidine synthase
VKITEGARKFAAEQGIAEDGGLAKGMDAKSKEVTESGSEVYAKA